LGKSANVRFAPKAAVHKVIEFGVFLYTPPTNNGGNHLRPPYPAPIMSGRDDAIGFTDLLHNQIRTIVARQLASHRVRFLISRL
jgi:hypothetical protein